jgi:succinate dehydrogenase/fumarate reductase flavoprotein subunit
MSPLYENRKWDLETDLLVIGAGAAGMTAALVGALEGLNTFVCEKSDMVSGTTATSAGTVWIPGSRQSEAAGVPDSIASAKTCLAAILGEDANDARLAAFLAKRRNPQTRHAADMPKSTTRIRHGHATNCRQPS